MSLHHFLYTHDTATHVVSDTSLATKQCVCLQYCIPQLLSDLLLTCQNGCGNTCIHGNVTQILMSEFPSGMMPDSLCKCLNDFSESIYRQKNTSAVISAFKNGVGNN